MTGKSARYLTMAVLIAGLTCWSVDAAHLKHFYSFDRGSLKDLRGRGPEIIIPEGFRQNLQDGGYYFHHFGYQYPGPILSSALLSADNYAIEVRFSLAEASLSWWHKLVDPRNLDPVDNGLYVLDGRLTYYHPGLGEWGVSGPDTIPSDTFVNVLITRDAESQLFRAYLDGELQIELPDPDGWTIFERGLIWFFTDDYNTLGGEGTTGFVDWIKVYDGPCTPPCTPQNR